jgi:hypothetical protein
MRHSYFLPDPTSGPEEFQWNPLRLEAGDIDTLVSFHYWSSALQSQFKTQTANPPQFQRQIPSSNRCHDMESTQK